MVVSVMEKFEKYWGDYSTLLAIAIALDPRYKMVSVRLAFSKLYVPLKPNLPMFDNLVMILMSIAFMISDLDSSHVLIEDVQLNLDAYLNSPLISHNLDTPFDILQH
ncbi:Zinc finger BED domain-containing protein RICESLEEPER 4 [Bienertia sinuspersici]